MAYLHRYTEIGVVQPMTKVNDLRYSSNRLFGASYKTDLFVRSWLPYVCNFGEFTTDGKIP